MGRFQSVRVRTGSPSGADSQSVSIGLRVRPYQTFGNNGKSMFFAKK